MDYTIRTKNRRGRGKKDFLDTFVLTDDLNEIKKDKELIARICYVHKKKPRDVIINLDKIEIENQYGETLDRF